MSKHLLDTSAFIEWLGKQDPNTEYEYFDNHNCLICQYFKSRGIENPFVDGVSFSLDGVGGKYSPLPSDWNTIATGLNDEYREFRPFASAQARARKLGYELA